MTPFVLGLAWFGTWQSKGRWFSVGSVELVLERFPGHHREHSRGGFGEKNQHQSLCGGTLINSALQDNIALSFTLSKQAMSSPLAIPAPREARKRL